MKKKVANAKWQMASRALPLRGAISFGPQILDGDDVQRVEGHDLTIAVHHRE